MLDKEVYDIVHRNKKSWLRHLLGNQKKRPCCR